MDLKSINAKKEALLDQAMIKNNTISDQMNSGETKNNKPLQGLSDTSGYDVSLSDEAKVKNATFAKAFQIAKQAPDVREEKIRELKNKIALGSYQVDSGKIADGIFREAIREHLSKESD